MKYIIVCALAIVIAYGVGYIFAHFTLKKSTAAHKGIKTVAITVIGGSLIFAAAALIYLSSGYRADENALTALAGNDEVSVSQIDGGYFFDGPSASKALIFYPGAKVECEAYAELMLKLAGSGCDCFLADMPFNFALLGADAADKFVNSHSYDKWLMVGHSMGGIMAAKYAQNHTGLIDGIVLLASYPTAKIGDSLELCSVYGSEDGCLELDVYNDNRKYWPEISHEIVIDGGNHAQFGSYGKQKSDGSATISNEEQQTKTADIILSYF